MIFFICTRNWFVCFTWKGYNVFQNDKRYPVKGDNIFAVNIGINYRWNKKI